MAKKATNPDIEEAETLLASAKALAPSPSLETTLKLADLHLQLSIARSLQSLDSVGITTFEGR